MGALIGITPIFVNFILLMLAMNGAIPVLLPAAVAALGSMLAWFLGRRQFDRYELAPSREAEYVDVGVERPGITDQFSPMVRVLEHAVWLKWGYLYFIIFAGVAVIPLMLGIGWVLMWFLFCFFTGMGTALEFNLIGPILLPIVPRRALIRSVLGPVAAMPVLIGCVVAIVMGSAQFALEGLATALGIVGMTWLMLPSSLEYRLPFQRRLRSSLQWALFICVTVCAVAWFVEGFHRGGPSIEGWSRMAPWVVRNSVLVSCVIVLAIVLLWRRCERKFKYFEASAPATPAN
jgi:hypothetical protein